MSLTSVIRYVRVLDSAATDGSGLTGKIFSDFTAKYNVQAGTLVSLTPQDISTLGTYQAPSAASNIRIKELAGSDPTKGVYEVHFHDTQVAAGGKNLWLYLSVTGGAIQPLQLDLIPTDGGFATSANYIGDYAPNQSAVLWFNTFDIAGEPITLDGTPTVEVLSENSFITAGINLVVDVNGRTGTHEVAVVLDPADGYVPGGDFAVRITAGTVNGQSVVGTVVGSFSIAKRGFSVQGMVNDGAATTTSFKTTLLATDPDFYRDQVCTFITGNLAGQSSPITAYAVTNGVLTFDEGFTSAPANNDTFKIIEGHVHPVTQIAAAVKDVAIETGIAASAALTNDSGTQLTTLSLGQAIAIAASATAGNLGGAQGPTTTAKPAGNASGNTRITASVSASVRTNVLKVPD
jgi:hypothetical protein